MVRILSERLAVCEDRLSELVRKEVPARLASLILKLIEHQAIVVSDGSRMVPTRFTHRQLASMIGANRETVTRAFGKLRRAGSRSETGTSTSRTRRRWSVWPTRRAEMKQPHDGSSCTGSFVRGPLAWVATPTRWWARCSPRPPRRVGRRRGGGGCSRGCGRPSSSPPREGSVRRVACDPGRPTGAIR
jgi:DNA-binding transcriptional MocR family regulator